MFTLGGFFLGLLIMIASFLILKHADRVGLSVGDLNTLLGFQGAAWLSWRLASLLGLLIGFLVLTGLLQEFIAITFGGFFRFGIG
jgi:hypothetical protein